MRPPYPHSSRPGRYGLLALLALLGALAFAQEVQLEARVFEIARQLRCPTCVSESVSDSSAPIAQQMREIIQEQLEQGRTEAQIFAYFQNRYGDWILLDPPKRGIHLVAWLLPIVIGVVAATVVALLARSWLANSRRPVEASPEDIERVRRQLGVASTQVEEPRTGGPD